MVGFLAGCGALGAAAGGIEQKLAREGRGDWQEDGAGRGGGGRVPDGRGGAGGALSAWMCLGRGSSSFSLARPPRFLA